MSPVFITKGYPDCTPMLEDPAALREFAEREGFLFFRQLLPRELVMELRRQLLTIVDKYGWLDRRHDLMEGVGLPDEIAKIPREELTFCGTGVHLPAYRDVQRLELFHSLPHNPNITRVFETLFGEAVLPHPRNIARLMLPSPGNVATPAHQDHIHIQGTKNVWTSWMPVGDCPIEVGNLSVYTRSHKDGILSPRAADGAGGLEVQVCDNHQQEWIEDDFQAGDVLMFHSLTVHKALPLQIPNRIRLSVDYRFQPASQEIEAASLVTHCNVLEWDEVYKGWQDEAIQYYWKNHDLNMSAWDDSIRWQKERICN